MLKKETREKLESLKREDVYSAVMFALYKLKDDPKRSTLSEIAYVLDGPQLMNFISRFGGLTITIPTEREFRLVINCLLLYQYVNLDGIDYKQAVQLVDMETFTQGEIKEVYSSIVDILDKYDFNRSK